MIGTLYIVATPIGNMDDITFRAISILKKCPVIVAEDTRHSRKLFAHYLIELSGKKLISMNDPNEKRVCFSIIQFLKMGNDVAVISDAGTPLICDPGYKLVSLARNEKIKIIPIPGPCAAICALSASGLPTNRFIFEGYLPKRRSKLAGRLKDLVAETGTIIIYETPHRIISTINIISEVFGSERKIAIARELTKIFEEIYLAPAAEIAALLNDHPEKIRGEFVILIVGKE